MAIQIVFETHSLSVDNERGNATGWLDGALSPRGRTLARELGRRRCDYADAVFTSNLGRALQTVELAFGGSGVPVFRDWRLRECDYGELNGRSVDEIHMQRSHRIDQPYPGGESWH